MLCLWPGAPDRAVSAANPDTDIPAQPILSAAQMPRETRWGVGRKPYRVHAPCFQARKSQIDADAVSVPMVTFQGPHLVKGKNFHYSSQSCRYSKISTG